MLGPSGSNGFYNLVIRRACTLISPLSILVLTSVFLSSCSNTSCFSSSGSEPNCSTTLSLTVAMARMLRTSYFEPLLLLACNARARVVDVGGVL